MAGVLYRGLEDGQTISNYHNFMLKQLKIVLDTEEFELVSGAPLEWLEEMYPHVVRYGGNVLYIEKLYKEWSTFPAIRVRLFAEAVSEAHPVYKGISDVIEDSIYFEKPDEILAKSKFRAEKAREEETFRYLSEELNYNINRNIQHFLYSEWVAAGLLALQMRETAINNRSKKTGFAMADYDLMTGFIRKYWGKIHPDDEDIYLKLEEKPHGLEMKRIIESLAPQRDIR